MVRITNGKNSLIVPTAAFEQLYKEAGWELAKKKKKIVEETEEKEVKTVEQNNKSKK